MKTIKPQKLGLLTRCYEFRQRFSLSVSVLMFVPLGAREDLYPEVSMWKFAAERLGKDGVIDAAMPKTRPEFLLTGSAYCPNGEPKQVCRVKVRLGSLEKTLYVYGDRHWERGLPGEPQPFTAMPLDWSRAFGGEGYDLNPVGRGVGPTATEKGTVHWLPNIQYPTQRVTSPDDRPTPAAFGPIDMTWSQRFSKAGTHDDVWLKEDFPGFARDMDWTIFNVAPEDQWLSEPLAGDEAYFLENMHPSSPIIEGRLPGMRARCFINRRVSESEQFEEVPTRLTTVWFFPDAKKAILVFHGSCETVDEDSADIFQIIIGAERLNEPKPAEHYREVLALHLDKEQALIAALRDSDMLPSGIEGSDPSQEADRALLEGKNLIARNKRNYAVKEIEKARAIVAGYGLDPDLHGPKLPPPEEPLPDLKHLPEALAKLEADAELQRKEAEESAAKSLQAVERLFADLGMDFNVVLEEVHGKPKGPPSFSAAAHIKAMEDLAAQLRKYGVGADEVEGYLADEGFCNRLYDAEQKMKESYRLTGHYQDPASKMDDDRAGEARQAVERAVAGRQSLAGVDLTGADLSGMNLTQADFEGAFLESVSFESSDLSDVNFRNAVLAHASLKNARLDRANLEGANLGGAHLAGAKGSGANLTRAILARADLRDSDFSGSLMTDTDFSETIFGNTDFLRIEGSGLRFLENDLRGLKLMGSHLKEAVFIKTDLSGVDFTDADLTSAMYLGVKAGEARFCGADMTNVRLVESCDFGSADFTDASVGKANLRGTSLVGCKFTGARLDGSDLSGCDLRNSNFYRCSAKETRFVKADLRDAVMISLNGMGASFERADIRGTDLRGANLFQSDLARVHGDGRTQLKDALTTKARVYPRRRR